MAANTKDPVAVGGGLAAIAYHSVVIMRDAADDDTDTTLRHPESPGENCLGAGTDWVAFRSAYDWHDVAVRMELWQEEPQPEATGPGATWADTWQTTFDVSAPGTFRVWELATGPTEDWAFHLPAAGTYTVRAYSTGSDPDVDLDQDELPPGTERWLIQFWPTGCGEGPAPH